MIRQRFAAAFVREEATNLAAGLRTSEKREVQQYLEEDYE